MDKATVRKRQKQIRKTALASADTVFYTQLYNNIKSVLMDFPNTYTVAGYYPIDNEIDILPVLQDIQNPTALPCTVQQNSPLIFKLWQQGDPMDTDIYNIPCPTANAPIVTPDIILVPLLAFDIRGYRLGYGGGFYDRTLEKYTPPITIGISINALQIAAVPTQPTDQRLTHIITETQIFKV